MKQCQQSFYKGPTRSVDGSETSKNVVDVLWKMILPQPELSVSGSIGVPIGDWHHDSREPRALQDVVCERWLRHVVVVCIELNWSSLGWREVALIRCKIESLDVLHKHGGPRHQSRFFLLLKKAACRLGRTDFVVSQSYARMTSWIQERHDQPRTPCESSFSCQK